MNGAPGVSPIIFSPLMLFFGIMFLYILLEKPIVDEETWNRAQEKLKEVRRLWACIPQNEYLLSGITCRKNYQGAKSTEWGNGEGKGFKDVGA